MRAEPNAKREKRNKSMVSHGIRERRRKEEGKM
jgi:hypothetical protein